MDNLDRLYLELVETLRRERPGGLGEPLTVSELHEELVPYQRVRDRAGFRSNADYRTALTRLLTGERGYLLSESVEMQAEVRAGLEGKVEDVDRYRAFPEASVRLNPERIPPPGHFRYAPPELREEAVRRADEVADRAREEETREEESSTLEPAAPAEAGEPMTGSGEPECCPGCGEPLPAAAVNYCPYCGARLGEVVCERCGASLDPDWRFCGTCGAEAVPGTG